MHKLLNSLTEHFANPTLATTAPTPTPTPTPTHPQAIYIKASTKLSDYYNTQLQPDVARQILQYKKRAELHKKSHANQQKHLHRANTQKNNIARVYLPIGSTSPVVTHGTSPGAM